MSLITHKNQKGFTLLELMVTVAIVGILAAIAIPIYNNYITKTRIAEALTHGRVYAGKVTIDKEDVVDPPANLEYSAISLAGSQENPRVRIKLKDTIDSRVLIDPDEWAGGKVIVLSEQSSDASVRWACTTNLPQALIPEGCTYEKGVKDRKLPEAWAKGKDACWSNARFNETGNGWAAGSCTSCTRGGQEKMNRKAKKGKRPGAAKKWGAACSGLYGSDEDLVKDGGGDSVDEGPVPWDPGNMPAKATACWDGDLSAIFHGDFNRHPAGGRWIKGPNQCWDTNCNGSVRGCADDPSGCDPYDSAFNLGVMWVDDFGYSEAGAAECVAAIDKKKKKGKKNKDKNKNPAVDEDEEAEKGRLAEEARVAALPPGEREREEAWDLKVKSGETDGMPWADVPAKERENDNVTVCWKEKIANTSLAALGNLRIASDYGEVGGWVVGSNMIDDPLYIARFVTQAGLKDFAGRHPNSRYLRNSHNNRVGPPLGSHGDRDWQMATKGLPANATIQDIAKVAEAPLYCNFGMR